MPRWHCVRTVPHGELTADIEIRLAGFELFAPTLWKPARPPRRAASGGATLPGKPDRVAPLFPRYLFVRFRRRADRWPAILKLPGVQRFLADRCGLPLVVPDAAIEALKALAAPNGCIYPPSKRDTPFAVGATARLLAGAMAELSGICTWSDGKRVRLLMTLLNREVSVTVAQSAVEAV